MPSGAIKVMEELKRNGHESVARIYQQCLAHEVHEVRLLAIESLSQFDDSQLVSSLMALLNEGNKGGTLRCLALLVPDSGSLSGKQGERLFFQKLQRGLGWALGLRGRPPLP